MKKYILTRTFFKTSCLLILVSSVLLTGCATALYNAAYKGETDTVKELLDKGADVNEKIGLDGITALMPASSMGRVDTVRLLLDRGADVNMAYWSTKLTSLSYAALYGHTDVARLLIERGADINKAIVGLLNFKEKGGDGTGGALELLNEFKRERDASLNNLAKQPAISAPASIKIQSDVDELPTIKTKPNKNAYAIVIGIEQYRQKLPKADFAVSDAKLVSEYLSKVMGYQEENIVTLTNENATKGDLEKYLDQWLKNVVEKNGTVFVYYSGHGAPSSATGDAYLVPYDGDPAFIEQTGYSLKRLYENLAKLPAKNIIVALDSCFSGAGGKSVSAKGSRALVRVEKTSALNIAVLTASLDNQISSSYEDKGHGVFTYFLLKGIKEMLAEDKNSKLELSELHNYIKPQVERTSRRLFNNEQTPQLITANEQMKNIGLR